MKKTALLCMLALGIGVANAQDEKIGKAHVSNYNSWAIGLNVGNMLSVGDLASFEPDRESYSNATGGFELGGGLTVTKWVNSVYAFQLQGIFGNISGTRGNTHFEGTLITGSLNFMLNLSALALKGKTYDRKWSWIASTGLGVGNSSPTLYFMDEEMDEEFQPESVTRMYVPFGLEVKRKLGSRWSLDIGTQFRYFFDDEIDGVRNGIANDASFYNYIGVSVALGNKDESVMWINPLDDMYMDMEEVKSNFDKLTADSDGDGVNDLFDKEPNTPEGTTVDGSGKSMDVDGDGIPDYMDADPYTSRGAKVDANGREMDADGDGVPDSRDLEPNTASGTLVNFQGKEVKTTGGGATGAYMPNVFFAFNSATVTAANHQRLATIAQMMKANPNISFQVIGHADKTGPEEYNVNLGMRRATAVIKALSQNYGIDESRFEAVSKGEGEMLATGRNDVNRRVEFIAK